MRSVCSYITQVLVATVCAVTGFAAEESPNILWITAEDMSAVLGCYGDDYATTPNIDRLAEQSVRYTHAFATAPVCSPSRSCLITGCYAPSLGTQQMRSAFPIPTHMQGFPALLRRRGYYTSNNVKTDYNTANWKQITAASWNESSNNGHWRNREDKSRPFFSVFNLMTSHQSRSMVWPHARFVKEVQSRLAAGEIHDPAQAPLPPYYPDTPVVRRTVARFYDCVTAMDKEVGALLKQLADDGLAEDTIVFFFSDHGSGLPRHKRALLDSGMHVPLLIRFPDKFKHLAAAKPGESLDRLVSFVDFGPTVLNLTGVDIPRDMQGEPFLGEKQFQPRKNVFGHRDRVDEVRDLARSIRDRRYLYIRNFMPHLGYNQPTAWPDQGEIRHEFYRLTDREKMTDAQWQFAGPTRPVEELYDCERDPLNLHNLADSVEYQPVRDRMRSALFLQLASSRDTGFVPESEARKMFAGTTPWAHVRRTLATPSALIDAASKVGTADEPELLSLLGNPAFTIRYWAAMGLAAGDSISAAARAKLVASLGDDSFAVRIEAANALARHGQIEAALPVLTGALQHKNLAVVLHAARTIQLLGNSARAALPAMRQVVARAEKVRPPDTPATVVQSGDQDTAMFIGFAGNAFLARVEQGKWTPLFDGKTLNGWTARAKGEVTVVDGAIQILAKGQNLWLLHEAKFDDFELQLEAKMPEVYNSGIGFRCSGAGTRPKGYQCEIDRRKSGMIYAIGSGWVWPRGAEQTKSFYEMAGDSFKDGEWNAFRIRCQGDRIEIWVNGVKTADVRDERHRSGSVALQHHGKGDVHLFRNIRIRKVKAAATKEPT